jgi:hypothetical protein
LGFGAVLVAAFTALAAALGLLAGFGLLAVLGFATGFAFAAARDLVGALLRADAFISETLLSPRVARRGHAQSVAAAPGRARLPTAENGGKKPSI